jgi:hypothetical protein
MERRRYDQTLCNVYLLVIQLVEVTCTVIKLYHPVIFVYFLSYCSQVGQTLQKAKKRMKDQFNKFGFGKMKKKDGSVEETPGSKFFFFLIKDIISMIFNVAPCMMPHLLYNPIHALFTL